MELSLRVMGSDEMEKNGALWRTILRQDPEGAWKAMQDGWDVRKTPSDFRNVKTTMGAFVMDKYLSVFAAPEFRRRSYDTAAKASRKSSRPADKKPAPAPAQKRSPKSSEQEFEKVNLENARSLVRDGEEDLLSERMVTALVRAGDELPPSVEHRFGKLIESILKKESPVPA